MDPPHEGLHSSLGSFWNPSPTCEAPSEVLCACLESPWNLLEPRPGTASPCPRLLEEPTSLNPVAGGLGGPLVLPPTPACPHRRQERACLGHSSCQVRGGCSQGCGGLPSSPGQRGPGSWATPALQCPVWWPQKPGVQGPAGFTCAGAPLVSLHPESRSGSPHPPSGPQTGGRGSVGPRGGRPGNENPQPRRSGLCMPHTQSGGGGQAHE